VIAVCQANESFGEVGWLEDLEVDVEKADVEGELVWGIGASLDDAAVRPVR
jgi:hypothetical protein